MSETPNCPNCNRPLAEMSEHDRQGLALANYFPWACRPCFAVFDGNKLWSIPGVQADERDQMLAVVPPIRNAETPKVLKQICEWLRHQFATESQTRYAWANLAPELLRELWSAMDKIGGTIPNRPAVIKSKSSVDEPYIQDVLDAIAEVVRWCDEKLLAPHKGKKHPAKRKTSKIRARQSGPGIALAHGGFRLRGGNVHELTGRPLQLLTVLLASRHHIATADRLRKEMKADESSTHCRTSPR
jgi:hypothetical protein